MKIIIKVTPKEIAALELALKDGVKPKSAMSDEELSPLISKLIVERARSQGKF